MTSKYEIETTAKYLMKLSYNIEGVVEVQDVIGALFGQTEGLMNDLELRELQKNGRIGRIKVDNTSTEGKSIGIITIPSSVSRSETILLAAALESVDRVGPCIAEIKLIEIKDVRQAKLAAIKERALDLMKKWKENAPESASLSDELSREMEPKVQRWQDVEIGPDAIDADEVILVEGRADIINLFRIGVTNTIAVNGVKIPQTIRELSKVKPMGAFLDGDRGGDMILSELFQTSDIKWVARAPKGKEVEKLDREELKLSLDNKVPAEMAKNQLKSEIDARAEKFADYGKRRVIEEEDFEDVSEEVYSNGNGYQGKPNGQNKPYQKSQGQFTKNTRKTTNYKGNEPYQNGQNRKPTNLRSQKRTQDTREHDSRRDNRNSDSRRDNREYDNKNKDSRRPRNDHESNGNRESYSKAPHPKPSISEAMLGFIKEIVASNEGILLGKTEELLMKVPNTEIYKNLDENCKTIIIDGVVTQRLVDKAVEMQVQMIIAVNIKPTIKVPDRSSLELYKFTDFV